MKNLFTKFDLHIHSPFSDGQLNLDLQIKTAIKLGLKIIGFSDHIFPFAFYKHPKNKQIFPSGFVTCYSSEFLKYRKKVFRFYERKYSQIRILNGAEIDIYPHGTLTLPRNVKPDFFDYLLIAKHHTIPKDLGFLFRRKPNVEKWLWKYDPMLKLNEYLWEKGVYFAFSKYKPDVFAHFQEGIPKSFIYFKKKEKMKRFVLMCKKFNVAIELNNLYWDKKRKLNHLTWCVPILEYGHEYGVKFSLASDFHGFEKDYEFYLNKSQEMIELVEKYDLELIDPRKFLPENRKKTKFE